MKTCGPRALSGEGCWLASQNEPRQGWATLQKKVAQLRTDY